MQRSDIKTTSFGPRQLASAFCLALLAACTTTIPIEEREARRAEINQDAEETIALLAEREPGFSEALEQSAGYFTARVSSTTVAVVGGAKGVGVLVDNRTGDRTFMDFKRLELGAGLGKRGFRALVLAKDAETFKRLREEDYVGSVATEATAGDKGGTGVFSSRGFKTYVISDSGASVAAVARLARTRVNSDLSDTGISEIRLPNIDFGIEDGREPVEQRTWEHKMPFMAQKVIDLGYDLPLPYGVQFLYSNIEQDQILEQLEVGFSGGEKVPYEWVDFENAVSWTDTWQMIGDVWLLPFLNLFAFVGDIKGDVTLDVFLDGNGLLEQAGIDCNRPGNLVVCRLLQDQVVMLPVESDFTGLNYGVGFNLAGGWNGWFFTLPVSFAWTDMDTTDVEGGAVISASPRLGRLIKLGSAGNLGLYLGGSYLDSDLKAHGSLDIPGTDESIDYTVDQANKDQWAGIVGANWSINSRWSVTVEYNGFFGSRESIFASVGWRF
jgi:hypothetical protein